MIRSIRGGGLAAALLVAGCSTAPQAPLPPTVPPPPPVVVAPPPAPENALSKGVSPASPVAIQPADAAGALTAFKRSCPKLVRRTDASGLTQPGDWDSLCAAAASVAPGGEAAFFQNAFAWVRVGDGKAFVTGYYEPEIRGSLTQQPGYSVPIYGPPTDLVRCTKPDGTTGKGRIDETGQCVLYYDRAAIEDGALANRGLEIAWAADPIDLFFVEIQGSGTLLLPDGSVRRIGYAGQNGRDYVAIGKLLKDRGLIQPPVTRDAIIAWMRANPAEGRALMRENLSYVFFKPLDTPGPLGALEVPVTPLDSVAADPKFVPLGAPLFLALDRPEPYGLWIAQDTGGAIKGANRFDSFWGGGAEAERIAGGMSASGQALILLPKPSLARIAAARAASQQ
ncbi:murein transglycosylase A [Sphingomonas sp. ASV193]|uniref:murein transglycosylase A n=1 Tax=Sphingomonas sp. ASV193 TaxID=3144405 RepID=UPI0032E869A8